MNAETSASDDRVLLQRAGQGEKAAFQAFYDRYAARVLAAVRLKIGSTQVAEDLVQDIFVAVWLNAPSYRPERGEPRSWLAGITHNKLMDHWRRLRRLGVALGLDTTPLELFVQKPYSDARLGLEQAWEKLTIDQRQVVSLVYVNGLTFGEAARALGVPVGTVKSRMHTALARMRETLKDRP